MKPFFNILSVLLIIVAATPVVAQEKQTCPEFRSLAEKAVPERVGDLATMQALLDPAFEPTRFPETLADKKTRKKARKALGAKRFKRDSKNCRSDGRTRGRAEDGAPGEVDCLYRSRKGEVLRLDAERGKVTLLNLGRDYDAAGGIDNKVTDSAAEASTMQTALAIGLPRAELAETHVTRLKAASVPVVDNKPDLARAEVYVAEVHVTARREIAGTPVFDSGLRSAIDVNGEVARMRLRWPRFCVAKLPEGDLSKTLMSRQEVVDTVVETLAEQNACRTLDRLSAQIMYVRAEPDQDFEYGDGRDEKGSRSDIGAAAGGEGCFLPALVTHAVPVEAPEDSGEISMGAPEYIVPLLRADRTRG